MATALGLLAGIIFLLYSPYFIKIIRGNPQVFEAELLQALKDWLDSTGSTGKISLWFMLSFSLFLEAGYFLMVFLVIPNVVMQLFTGFLIGEELVHLLITGINIYRYIKGRSSLETFFNWSIERASALLFFTHAFLVLIQLIT